MLTQKQVRELRRLCRKTANRAEFECRLIQIRQIASIAAMGTPAIKFFDPENPTSGAALRAWVEIQRDFGADWRDERVLADDAIEELRRWDRGLKAWALLRFENPPCTGPLHIYQPVTTSLRAPPGFSASSPITPYISKSKLVDESQYSRFSSPVSPDTDRIHIYSDPIVQMDAMDVVQETSLDKSGAGPELSIDRVGDTINITVPSNLLSDSVSAEQLSNAAGNNQENVYPASRRLPLHAVNTAKSWRNSTVPKQPEFTLAPEKELAFRNAAKTLFSNSSKDVYVDTSKTNTTAERASMDWGNLRRPVLRPLSVNTVPNDQARKS